MAGNDEDRGKSRRLAVEDQGWSSTGRVLGGRMIKMSSYAMCDLHHVQRDEVLGFLGLASKPRSMIPPSLASKSVATVLVVLPQNHLLRFPVLGLKTGSYGLVIWATKSP
jgi:hypothetical protein